MKPLVLAVAALAACHTAIPAAPVDHNASATPLGAACVHLRDLGCPEGSPNRKGRTCFDVMTNAAAIADVPTSCLVAAMTVEAIRACGDEHTVRVRCVK